MPVKFKDGGYRLPETVDPPRFSICIEVPDDINHIAAFVGAISELTWTKNWERDSAHTGAQVARVWQQIVDTAVDKMNNGERCMSGEPCCDELGIKMDESNKTLTAILNLLRDGFKIVPLGEALPDDYRIDCTPTKFDGDDGDTDPDAPVDRATALCLTVSRYVLSVLYFLGKRSNFSTQTKSDILALMDLDAPPDFYPQLVMGNIDSVTLQQISRIAGTDTSAFENVVCAMVAGLTDKQNTFDYFKNSLVDVGADSYPDVETHWLTEFIVAFNGKRQNFNVFAKELDSSYDEIAEGLEYECPCVPEIPPCDDDLVMVPVNDCTVTFVSGHTWHVQQTNLIGTIDGHPNARYAAIKDQFGRCFKIASASQAMDYGNQIPCSDSIDPNSMIESQSASWENDIDTLLDIFCDG
jgi:hypothetical protein